MALSLVSVMVNGLRDADKRLSFLQWLSHHSPLVVCLQETHALSSDELSQWFSRFGYLCLGSFGSSHSCGVAILYRPVLSCSAFCDFDGRFVLGGFTFRDSVFRVACCYAPNRNHDRDAFFHRCINSIDPSVLLSCVVILIPFLIVLLTVVAPALLILPARVLTCCLSSFVTVVSLTFGVLSILGCLVLHGPRGMAH